MRPLLLLLLCCAACCARAQQVAVMLEPPPAQAWQGEAVPVVVQLRAQGTFSGAAQFDLPQVPGALIVRIGNPVVSALETAGVSWFVQRHEFALIAQRSGELRVPAFAVRFAAREGFTGDAVDRSLEVPGWAIRIQHPPGVAPDEGFVTSTGYAVDESWEGVREAVRVGDVLVRRIHQRADGTSGMVLLPARADAPDGLRVYRGRAQVQDRSERGVVYGERTETLSYLPAQPGHQVLPALAFRWWNPATAELHVETLPALEIEVLANASTPPAQRGAWRLAVLLALAGATATWIWRRARRRWPGARVSRAGHALRAMARLLLACHRNAAVDAHAAWWAWQRTGCWPGGESARLRAAISELQGCLYAERASVPWSGRALARAALGACRARRVRGGGASALPPLNPAAGNGASASSPPENASPPVYWL